MTPIAIVEEALTEGRALFAAAGELRDLFTRGRADVEALTAEARETVDGLLTNLRAGLDAFKAQSARAAADPAAAADARAEGPAPAAPTFGG